MKRILLVLALCLPLAAQVAINDTITLADGTAWRGTVEVSWPAFTTATGTAVARGSRTVAVTAGTLSISLYANEGSAPTAAYTATFRGNASWSETWSLAASPSVTTLRAVRRSSTLMFFPSQIVATGKANGTYCLNVASDAVDGLAACAPAWSAITGKPSTFAPSAHASAHASAGSDPVTPAAIGAEAANANIQAHIGSTANPHAVTKTQVGLGSVDNTADTAKPVSAAQAAAIAAAQAASLPLHGKADTAGAADTATSATGATNLAGGSAGQFPYQTGSGATGFRTPNTANGPVVLDASGNATIGATVSASNLPISVTAPPYSATGLGVACDDAAINAAITAANAAGGGIVFVPVGTYKLCTTIHMKPGVELVGPGMWSGAKLKVMDKVQSALTSTASAAQSLVVVADVTGFKVGQEVTLRDNAHLGYGTGDSGRIASINVGTKTITLEGSIVNGPYTAAQSAVLFTTLTAVSFETPTSGGTCGAAAGVINATVRDLEIDGNSANQSVGNYDCVQSGVGLGNSHYAKVLRNYIHDLPYFGVLADHYVDGGHNGPEYITVEGNYIVNGTNCATKGDSYHADGTKWSSISRNIMFPCGSTSTALLLGLNGANNVYADNVISGGTVGINVQDEVNSTIRGGSVSGTTSFCISITQATTLTRKITVDGVQLSNCGDYAIKTLSPSTHHLLTRNNISGANGGILSQSPFTLIDGNDIEVSGANGLENDGADSIVSHNKVTGGFYPFYNSGANTAINANKYSGTRPAITNAANGVAITANVLNTNDKWLVNTGTAGVKWSGNTNAGLPLADNPGSSTFAGLSAYPYAGTYGVTTDGDILYCSDCTVASPCAGGGSGAFAKRVNSGWVCN